MNLPVALVDVFAHAPFTGNPLAVVVVDESAEADLSGEQMQRIANWMNLSETTFLLPPTVAEADYRVRIFTPSTELPFAGHPTLGTAWVWLHRGASAKSTVVQECGAGLVELSINGDRLAFKAPPLIRSGPVDPDDLQRFARQLNLELTDIVDAAWVDNGPGWVGLLLESAEAVLAVEPGALDHKLGVVGSYIGLAGAHADTLDESAPDLEVRAFFPVNGSLAEDPVTGSLNASLAQWLVGSGRIEAPYTAAQGTRLGRSGRVYVDQDDDGEIWVGGSVVGTIDGTMSV